MSAIPTVPTSDHTDRTDFRPAPLWMRATNLTQNHLLLGEWGTDIEIKHCKNLKVV